MERKEQIITALHKFISQRPGMDFANYGDVASYRSESRSITKARHDACDLLREVDNASSITADDIIAASKSAFSGRLSIVVRDDGKVVIDYCTGQYFPTEYRNAVAAVMVQLLWNYYREHCGCDSYDKIVAQAKRSFRARSITRRFN